MKFQNISIHGSKVMLCTRKCDKRKNEQPNEQTDKLEAISAPPPHPTNVFKIGGIKTLLKFMLHLFTKM